MAALETKDRDVERVLAERYGRSSNWRLTAVVSGLGAVGLGLLAWLGLQVSDNPVSGRTLGWTATEETTTVEVEVRGESTHPLTCYLRAKDIDASDVGYGQLNLPGAPAQVRVAIPTIVESASVEVLGCGKAGEPQRVPPADYPPGVAAPPTEIKILQ